MSTVSVRRACVRRSQFALALVAALALAPAAGAQEATSAKLGLIEFNHPGTAKATVEVDLTRDMFSDLFGIGDAALAGVTQALTDSPQAKEGSAAIQQAAAQAAATRELVSIAKNVIDDVRIRVYQGLQSDADATSSITTYYTNQLEAGDWDQAVRVQDGNQSVRISTVRADGAIKGLFVIVNNSNDLVLVNVTCDISPESAKKLSEVAVRSGLQAGLEKHLEKAMKHMK